MNPAARLRALAAVASLALVPALCGEAPAQVPAPAPPPAAPRQQQPAGPRSAEPRPQASPQPRRYGVRVAVDPARVVVDDGDTVVIRWPGEEAETVRVLGIDTPETRHLEHNLPYAQPFGPEARGFAQGAFAAATQVELLRAATLDPYGRSLAYLFINGRNYSVLVIRARYSGETVSFYGDNGLPREAAEVVAAAREAGPLPFEPPHVFRARMRELVKWMKEHGVEAEE
jgi:micrococcal nuclease